MSACYSASVVNVVVCCKGEVEVSFLLLDVCYQPLLLFCVQRLMQITAHIRKYKA